jgi:hypothetical protein
MRMKSNNAAECIGAAYLALLSIPHNHPARLRLQSVLATVRDEVAEMTGLSPEEVQASFETTVLH